MRYCGHTLSRLKEFGHNMTKQVRFPTTRRKGLKSRTTVHVVSLCRTPSTSDSEPSNASKVIFAMALKVKGLIYLVFIILLNKM